jgi:hypothetical protein
MSQQHTIDRKFYETEINKQKLITKASELYKFPAHTIETAITQLTESVQNILDITAASPKSTNQYLKSCTNPLLSPEDFQTDTVIALQERAKERNNPNLAVLAGELSTLRKFFVQDKELHSIYKREIEMISGNNKEDDFTKFLSTTTKHHLEDVVGKIQSSYLSK